MNDLHDIFESGLPLATSALALIPLIVLLTTYRRTKSKRILIAASAFGVIIVKGVLLGIGLLVGTMDYQFLELTEFGADFITVALFAISFLWSFRKSDEERI